MDTDRRRTSKSKRYELGYYLAIDWCKVPYILMILLTIYLISSVTASAYHNTNKSRENEIIQTEDKPIEFVQKLISRNYDKEIEADPNIDLVIPIDHKNISFDHKNVSSAESIRNDSVSANPTSEESLYDLLNDIEFDSSEESNSTEEIPESTEFDIGSFEETTIVDEEYKSTTDIMSETATLFEETTESFTENILSLVNIVSLNSNKSSPSAKRESDKKSSNDTRSLPGLNSTTLKNIVLQIQEQVNRSLNDSLHSDENVIEDSYDVNNLTFSDKKSNKTEVSKDKVSSNSTGVLQNLKIEERIDNVNGSNSSKSLEDDYNMSYEMEEYDDEKIFSMKKSVTEAPSSGAFDAIRDFAGSFMETIYETYVPKGLKDLFRRMQEQNEKLETIRLRSKEENGGIGQLGRSIIKGITVPINQLMQGVRDYGSLDSDKNFFAGVASGVVSMADSVGDSFKDRVRAIFPGTLWCGDGDKARSAEVGVFFMTDSCCRRHDACKFYILSGDTKYGLTNTGLFTRSHCECDKAFYRCLKRTNSLISSQIGLTYFSILGPQCFKREHPIVRCKRRTRITNQKCEEYELDYTQPKSWQWFDNETF